MLGRGETLASRNPPPPHCFSIILLHTHTLPVIVTESILREHVTLQSREAVPPDCLGLILRDIPAVIIGLG
jgi:hypothetical protein